MTKSRLNPITIPTSLSKMRSFIETDGWILFEFRLKHAFLKPEITLLYQQKCKKNRQIFMRRMRLVACVWGPISLNASTGGITTDVFRVSCVMAARAATLRTFTAEVVLIKYTYNIKRIAWIVIFYPLPVVGISKVQHVLCTDTD